jgi:hypothetical protein
MIEMEKSDGYSQELCCERMESRTAIPVLVISDFMFERYIRYTLL